MAIVYKNDLPTDKILCAYNNNVIRFNSNSIETPISATITFNGLTVTLYPNPTGFFYFNFKDYITGLINTDNFKDNAPLLLPTVTPYVNWTSKVFLYSSIDITVNLANETTDTDNVPVNWLATMFQLDNKGTIPATLPKILHEDSLLTFYPNLPFDLTILTPQTGDEYYFTNIDNSLSLAIEPPHGQVNRLIISDGDLEYGLFDLGLNNFELTSDKIGSGDGTTVSINRKVITCFKGIYIKWINSLGGWNYHYFESWRKDQTTKDTFELNNDFDNLEDTLSKIIQGGKTGFNKIVTKKEFTTNENKEGFLSLFTSPKIYLYTGTFGQQTQVTDWLEVSLTPSTINLSNSHKNQSTYNLTFELPPLDTRTV